MANQSRVREPEEDEVVELESSGWSPVRRADDACEERSWHSTRTMRAELERQRAELERKDAELERKDAELERQRAELERKDAELERQRVELERKDAELERQRAELERQRAELERQRAELERKDAKLAANKRAAMKLREGLVSMRDRFRRILKKITLASQPM